MRANLIVNCENGVLFQSGAQGLINNATIVNCDNAGISLRKGDSENLTEGWFLNNILWDNGVDIDSDSETSYTLNYSNSGPTTIAGENVPHPGEGNINIDPLFTDAGSGDFSLGSGSPSIDSGHASSKYNDACLPPGKKTERNDMGAYGGPYNCGWTLLSHYDILDHILGRKILTSDQRSIADENNDGKIDISDVITWMNNVQH
jgi:hypothetical protein